MKHVVYICALKMECFFLDAEGAHFQDSVNK